MKSRFGFPDLVFYGISALMLVISVVSLAGAISWIGKPFPGFLVYDQPYVASLGNRDWPGPKAEIKYLDRIVAVDDQPVVKGREVVAIAKSKKPGAPIHYLVETEGETREVNIPTPVFNMRDFLLVFLISFFFFSIVNSI